MRGGARSGLPGLALPVGEARGWSRGQPFPPRLPGRRRRDIGEDRVRADHGDRARIGLGAGIGGDAEEPALRIDGAELPVLVHVDPGDVIPQRPHAVAGELGDDHGQVRLARRARHGGGEIGHLPVRILHAEDQHVLGEPSLLPRLERSDAQGVALLAEKRIAPVARPDAPDELLLGEMQDETAVGREVTEGVQPRDEVVVAPHVLDGHLPHPRHEVHARDDVGAVGDHDADAAHRRARRAHEIRDDVHRAPAHRPVEVRTGLRLGFGRRHPVVRRTRVVLGGGADEGELLRARHVRRVAAVQVAARIRRLIHPEQRPVPEHQLDQPVVLRLRPVTPHRAVGPCEPGDGVHPFLDHARHGHATSPSRDGKHPARRHQWDINTGMVICRRMCRVAPPSTNSPSRECP